MLAKDGGLRLHRNDAAGKRNTGHLRMSEPCIGVSYLNPKPKLVILKPYTLGLRIEAYNAIVSIYK